jgi:hypothetical protein
MTRAAVTVAVAALALTVAVAIAAPTVALVVILTAAAAAPPAVGLVGWLLWRALHDTYPLAPRPALVHQTRQEPPGAPNSTPLVSPEPPEPQPRLSGSYKAAIEPPARTDP